MAEDSGSRREPDLIEPWRHLYRATVGTVSGALADGVATVEAITSGLAPGSDAETDTTGKSTWGSGETGSSPNDTMPASATPSSTGTFSSRRRRGTAASSQQIQRPPGNSPLGSWIPKFLRQFHWGCGTRVRARPNSESSRRRSRARARYSRDSTVPFGVPITAAASSHDNPCSSTSVTATR